jgi:ferredoxin
MADSAAEELVAEGLNLQASFVINQLPDDLKEQLHQHAPESTAYRNLMLFGNGGTRLWQCMQKNQQDETHLVDSFFIDCIDRVFADSDYKTVYPGNHFLPLQGLGRLAGWHHDSTMGLGIHPVFGLWFAYRGAVLTNTEFSPYTTDSSAMPESPCDTCEREPCITACPARAVTTDRYQVRQCTDYRLQAESSCQSRCISRQVCPLGKEHQYLPDQMKHHYDFSLAAIKRYSK